MARTSSKPVVSPLNPEAAELIARRFRALSDPTRLRILDHLRRNEEVSVGELTETLGTSQQNVSKHLGVLHEAGILGRRKQGTHTLYSIADESVLALCEQVCGGLQRQFSDLAQIVGSAVR
jgi:DNA-binding transcriptional ArsR family regulator